MSAPLVVIGDLMLDIDLVGRAERFSPEAPVPVLSELTERRRPGGAALVAWLAANSGRRPVVLIAPCAEDGVAAQVAGMLGDGPAGRVELVAVPWQGSTPVKTRVRIGDHPLARLDTGGEPGALGPLPDRARQAIGQAAAVLVCDYGRGATGEGELRQAIAGAAGRLPVIWDPHPVGSRPVPGCALVTPNEAELVGFAGAAGLGSPAGAGRSITDSARALAARWQARAVAVTLGERGAMVCLGDHAPLMIRGEWVQASDSCGAGDSFAAAAALALADGRLPTEAVGLAVAAANRFVAAGAASAVCQRSGRYRPTGAPSGIGAHRHAGRPDAGVLVATGGCFDLLHAGHVAALEAARSLGDRLVVCLNSDASVRRLKGPDRPLQPQQDRARVLQALRCVDEVVIFDEDTPASVLRRVRPDIWVKGGDYTGADLPEASVLAEWGGEAVIVPYLAGRSTSALVQLAARPASR